MFVEVIYVFPNSINRRLLWLLWQCRAVGLDLLVPPVLGKRVVVLLGSDHIVICCTF